MSKKRTKRNPNVYIQLIEGYRNSEGKVRNRVVKHIGTAKTEENIEKIVELANKIKELLLTNKPEDKINTFIKDELNNINGNNTLILNCEPVSVIHKGISDVYGKVFDDIGLNKIIFSRSNYSEIFKALVIGKLSCLGSKKKIAEELSDKFNKNYNLNAIYRTMDKIDTEVIEIIKNKISMYNKNLLGNEIKVLFYDATTIYFESFSDDELRQLGYSKDLKFNQPQIVFTMLVTEKGLPLSYELFSGSTYEGNTLQQALKKWRSQYPTQKITLVADSGMLNAINLDYLENEGFDYIVCARLKSFSKAVKEKIYTSKNSYNSDYFHEISLKTRRLIVSYRENRAIKDRADRDKNITKLSKKLSKNKSPASLISNYGYKKFITVNKNSEVVLNEEKIIEAEKWDGLHGVITNIKSMSPEEIYGHYRNLYQIEDAFRINKTDLKIRPVFHWSPSRIISHIALSYIAFCCYKAVEYKYNEIFKEGLSHRKIKEILSNTKIAIYQDKNNGTKISMPLPIPKLAYQIYKSQELKLDLSPRTVAA